MLRACPPEALGTNAGVLFEQGKLDGAIATYREALAHEPNFPEAYNNLGNALREAGRVDEAIQCYTLCIQLQMGRRAPLAPTLSKFQLGLEHHSQSISITQMAQSLGWSRRVP